MYQRSIAVLCHLLFTVVLILMLTALAGAAQPKEVQTDNLVFILDASGSMWGKVGGKAKITIAKEVMTDLIKGLSEGLNVGLVAYGHQRKGDCGDVQELAALGPLNKKHLINIIQALIARGKTPITLSIRKTAEKLKTLEDETTIILVSDGKETCGADPCPLVKELREAGINFVLHVIGFDVTDEERKQLTCIAQAGGGEYYSANNASDFKIAARKAVQESDNAGFLMVKATKNGKPISAKVKILSPDGKRRLKAGYTLKGYGKPRSFRLRPGKYKIVVIDEEVPDKPDQVFKGVIVKLGQTTELKAEFRGAILRIKAQKKGKPAEVLIKLRKAGRNRALINRWTSIKKPIIFNLRPGVYDLIAIDERLPQKPRVEIKGIEIAGGQTIDKTIEFAQEGVLNIKAVKAGKPAEVLITIREAGGKTSVITRWTSKKKPTPFKLQAGKYDLTAIDQRLPQKPRIEVKGIEIISGKTSKRKIIKLLDSTS